MGKRIYLSSPHMSGREQKYIKEAFDANWIAPLGKNVDMFEKELRELVGAKAALAVNSGTSAIHTALRLLNVGPQDIVFCSTLTFVASANPILYQGATPVFIDSEPNTWNMSPIALEKAFQESKRKGKLPKAVIVVNLYGQSADMDPIMDMCQTYNVPIIEDAAESLGAYYKGKSSGTFGKFGIYSFNGNKIITTSGGGMLVSDDEELIARGRYLVTQAREQAVHYQHSEYGYNYRMSNVLAGIGRGQLEVLKDRVQARRNVFQKYYDTLQHVKGITFMPEPEGFFSTRWLTALTIKQNDQGEISRKLIQYLEEYNIESRPVWKPMHLQPLFKDYEYFTHFDHESVADELFKYGICLPSGSNITEEEQDLVIDKIKEFLQTHLH
jgi:pyridoxal phosphate-dependent aminotransferase EpsN